MTMASTAVLPETFPIKTPALRASASSRTSMLHAFIDENSSRNQNRLRDRLNVSPPTAKGDETASPAPLQRTTKAASAPPPRIHLGVRELRLVVQLTPSGLDPYD